MADPAVYVGTPYAAEPGRALDAYASRIGGVATWLRSPPPPPALLRCQRCGTPLALLSQIHAPLAVFDRVLFVLGCTRCGVGAGAAPPAAPTAGGSGEPGPAARVEGAPVLVLRSQVFNPAYDTAADAAAAETAADGRDEGQALFDGGGAWGGGADEWGDDEPSAVAAAEPPPPPPRRLEPFPLCVEQPAVPKAVRKAALPVLLLDSFREPRAPREAASRDVSDAEALAALGGAEVVDGTAEDAEEDAEEDESPADEFVDRLRRCPAQAVRWGPGAAPLRASRDPELLAPLPECELCGAARRYELQLVAPAVYFLTKGASGGDRGLRFAAVDVATCSENCYSEGAAYCIEYGRVQDEI